MTVASYLLHDICHVANVSSHNQRRCSNAPHAKLSAVLSISLSRTVFHYNTIGTALF